MTSTPNKGYTLPVVNGNPQTWGVLLNADLGLIDGNLGGFVQVNCAGNSNITISSAQAANLIIQLTGTLTGNIYVFMPAVGGMNIIDNETSGAYTVTIQSAGGGSISVLPQGYKVITYNDTTNQNLVGASGLFQIATGTILANVSGGSTLPYAVTTSAMLDYSFGNSQGSVLYRGSMGWAVLGPGTSGQVLTSLGTGQNPSWTAALGTGTVTNVTVGTTSSSMTSGAAGLLGGAITTTGTITRDPVFDELCVVWYR